MGNFIHFNGSIIFFFVWPKPSLHLQQIVHYFRKNDRHDTFQKEKKMWKPTDSYSHQNKTNSLPTIFVSRRRTLCPSWPLPSCATPRCCPSTVSWKSKCTFPKAAFCTFETGGQRKKQTPLFLQSQQEEDADRLQPVHLCDARHVYDVGAIRLPHLLR